MGGWITRFSAKASKPVYIAAAQPPPICLKLPNWYHHQPEPHQLSLKDLHRNAMQLFSDVGVYLYPRPQTSLLLFMFMFMYVVSQKLLILRKAINMLAKFLPILIYIDID